MKIADIDQLKIGTLLPSPKGVALALLEACQREDVTINEITKLIQTDPALSGRLIQRANATNQRSRATSSVFEAEPHVGIRLFMILLGIAIIVLMMRSGMRFFSMRCHPKENISQIRSWRDL